jgi:hypothetical protein
MEYPLQQEQEAQAVVEMEPQQRPEETELLIPALVVVAVVKFQVLFLVQAAPASSSSKCLTT